MEKRNRPRVHPSSLDPVLEIKGGRMENAGIPRLDCSRVWVRENLQGHMMRGEAA